MKNSTIIAQRRPGRQLHKVCQWVIRSLAMLVALELALLNPLSCVLHCLIQQWQAAHATPAWFLCDLHPATSAESRGAEPLTASAPMIPRAVYEALPPVSLALLALLPLAFTLGPIRLRVPLRIAIPPPTPPPRLRSC